MPLSTFGKYDSSLLFILTWNEFTVTLKYILKIVLTTNALSINKYNPHKNQSSKKSLTIKLEWDLCLTESIYRTCKQPYLSISQSLAIILMSVLKWSTNIIDFFVQRLYLDTREENHWRYFYHLRRFPCLPFSTVLLLLEC